MDNGSRVQLTDDQYFLLYFIMGAYLAPDLKEGRPHKSALQRHAEGLPKYIQNDLAGSRIKTMVLESVYYYILRKADESVVLKHPLLLQYIQGSLPILTYPQFHDLFPPNLHRRSKFENHHDTIDNIIFIHNPEIDYMKTEDIERFKRLTGLKDFLLDRESAMANTFVSGKALDNVEVPHVNGKCLNYAACFETYPKGNKPSNAALPSTSSLCNAAPQEDLDHGMIFFPSCPCKEEWSDLVASVKCGFGVTGSAARGNMGPVLGLMDIGESEDSYLFRVSLPGVRRDECKLKVILLLKIKHFMLHSMLGDFSCEVESDGRVIIKGVTVTGERRIEKYKQEFEMLSQNLCPVGPFSISFKLPGPVDPLQFHGNFGTDGILEGIALKATR
ncbi:hypothetical protein CDL12_29202 [Handroanthus impetiginosus]|uniref:SHSP domain-containing protein n=1 Tax=Handroanthus impetiginosus TaxID=429701 RepID=A0A2G9G085_9LAMI|nr:hypothetical protein CDL12_29202 [Handroanthus impetiginosus]